jgi:hypothetical protein
MREKLNENPMAQAALIGVLLVAAALMLLKPFGGGGESEESAGAEAPAVSTEETAVEGTTAAVPGAVPAATAATAPLPPRPLPAQFLRAYDSGRTVVLLVVDDGGIDDRLVARSTSRLAAMPGVATFIVPASKIARYASITDGVGVNRVPALLVVRPKRLSHGQPTASVSYGFQGPQSVVQAVVDARYQGRTLSYHP